VLRTRLVVVWRLPLGDPLGQVAGMVGYSQKQTREIARRYESGEPRPPRGRLSNKALRVRLEELKGAHSKVEIGVLGERRVRFLVSTTSPFSVSYSGLPIVLSLDTPGKTRTCNAWIRRVGGVFTRVSRRYKPAYLNFFAFAAVCWG
jgi:hypothetical protein